MMSDRIFTRKMISAAIGHCSKIQILQEGEKECPDPYLNWGFHGAGAYHNIACLPLHYLSLSLFVVGLIPERMGSYHCPKSDTKIKDHCSDPDSN